ncbi:hypothetical protein QL285_027058 [Trifolium repens]|nr:hypothetical protein QL285_027058 [Trifolium repens]
MIVHEIQKLLNLGDCSENDLGSEPLSLIQMERSQEASCELELASIAACAFASLAHPKNLLKNTNGIPSEFCFREARGCCELGVSVKASPSGRQVNWSKDQDEADVWS